LGRRRSTRQFVAKCLHESLDILCPPLHHVPRTLFTHHLYNQIILSLLYLVTIRKPMRTCHYDIIDTYYIIKSCIPIPHCQILTFLRRELYLCGARDTVIALDTQRPHRDCTFARSTDLSVDTLLSSAPASVGINRGNQLRQERQ